MGFKELGVKVLWFRGYGVSQHGVRQNPKPERQVFWALSGAQVCAELIPHYPGQSVSLFMVCLGSEAGSEGRGIDGSPIPKPSISDSYSKDQGSGFV